jgi:hypothetical protein
MKPLVKVPLKYGVIAGLIGAALLIILYYMGHHPFLIPIFFDFRIFLFGVFVFFTLKELRDLHQGGIMSFGEAMVCSFLFIATYALIAAGIMWIFGSLENDFVSSFIRLFKEQANTLSEEDLKIIGKENLERNLEALSSTNAGWMAWNYLKQCFWIGMFIGIILSVTLRRQPKS